MPNLTPLVLTDGTADRTFNPVNINQGVAALEVNTGVPIGNPRITISTPVTASGKRKVSLKLALPVVQDAVVGGVTRKTVVRTAYADIQLSFDQTSETAERVKVLNMLSSLFGSANIFTLSATDLSGFY